MYETFEFGRANQTSRIQIINFQLYFTFAVYRWCLQWIYLNYCCVPPFN